MTAALLHFDSGVPIDDCDCRTEHKERLARVHHVYWQWVKNPWLDTKQLFKQLVKGQYKHLPNAIRAANKDQILFEFVVDHVAAPSRRMDEMKVRAAAEQAIKIGMETDNVVALTKGGKLLYDVAHLGQPESETTDLTKATFLPSVVVTNAHEIDDSKDNYEDEETRRITAKYGGYVDEKRKMIEDKVALMEAKGHTNATETTDFTDDTD